MGDVSNDGKVDLITCYFDHSNIAMFIQEADEPFDASIQLSTDNHSRPSSLVIGHFDNDKHSDIAVINSVSINIGIFLGYGNGDFAREITFLIGLNSLPSAITADHFNDDGMLDIAVANDGAEYIEILLQTCSLADMFQDINNSYDTITQIFERCTLNSTVISTESNEPI